jgi:hypothetical protein
MAKITHISKKNTASEINNVSFEEISDWYDKNLRPNVMDLDDQETYKVYEKGKWAGIFQCVDENTEVMLSDDSTKPIKNIQIGDIVKSYDEKKYCFVDRKVTNVFDQGFQKCYEFVFDNDHTLICTKDHLIRTECRWVEAIEMPYTSKALTLEGSEFVKLKSYVGIKHVYDIEVEETHNFIANGIVVHNCTGEGAQQLFMKAKPKSITDIAVLTSIFRPGPLAAKVDEIYLEAKNNGKFFDWGDKRVNELMKNTHGCLIFQEQVLLLAEKMAGFPKEQCDEVRRAIMKRSISGGEAAKQQSQKMRDDFVKGSVKNGFDEKTANNVYDKILVYAGYGFNLCLNEFEEVFVFKKDGSTQVKQIKDVQIGDIVRSRDEKSKKDFLIPVSNKHDHGIQELVEVELTSGEKICCTLDHKFRTIETGEMLPLWKIIQMNLSIVVQIVQTLNTTVNDVEKQ